MIYFWQGYFAWTQRKDARVLDHPRKALLQSSDDERGSIVPDAVDCKYSFKPILCTKEIQTP